MSTSADRIETAMMAAEHAARQTLLAFELDVKSLVLTVAFDSDGAILVAASSVPKTAAGRMAESLHESAVEAGWSCPTEARPKGGGGKR